MTLNVNCMTLYGNWLHQLFETKFKPSGILWKLFCSAGWMYKKDLALHHWSICHLISNAYWRNVSFIPDENTKRQKFTCDLISKFNFCDTIVIQDELVESVICNHKFNILGMKKKGKELYLSVKSTKHYGYTNWWHCKSNLIKCTFFEERGKPEYLAKILSE